MKKEKRKSEGKMQKIYIGDLCVINDRNSFFENFKEIYSKELST